MTTRVKDQIDTDLQSSITTLQGQIPVSGAVGLNDVQTLTNKTILHTGGNTVTLSSLNSVNGVSVTAPVATQYLAYNGTNWVNKTNARAYGYFDGNTIASGAGGNSLYFWVRGTIIPALLNNFTVNSGGLNSITYTGTTTKNFKVTYSAVPIVGSNDRTVVIAWLKNPATADITPAVTLPSMPTGYIGGSRELSIVRTSISDTDGCAGCFVVSLANGDSIRCYTANVENNDPVTVSDFRFFVEEII